MIELLLEVGFVMVWTFNFLLMSTVIAFVLYGSKYKKEVS